MQEKPYWIVRLLWALIAQHSNPTGLMQRKAPLDREAFVGADRAALEPHRFDEIESPAARGTMVGAEGLEPPTTSV